MKKVRTERLTEAQRRVLRRLADGDKLHFLSGLYGHYFWDSGDGPVARSDTLSVLRVRGLVEDRNDGRDAHITLAGRALLEDGE